jgi:acyl-CoA dehydrogenase
MFKIEDALLDEIFDFMIRDFSKYALTLFSKPSNTEAQKEFCMKMIKSPVANEERFLSIWTNKVLTLKGQYTMNE